MRGTAVSRAENRLRRLQEALRYIDSNGGEARQDVADPTKGYENGRRPKKDADRRAETENYGLPPLGHFTQPFAEYSAEMFASAGRGEAG